MRELPGSRSDQVGLLRAALYVCKKSSLPHTGLRLRKGRLLVRAYATLFNCMHALPGSRKYFASDRAALNADEALYPCCTGAQHACTCTQTGTHLDEEHTQKTQYECFPPPHFYDLDTFNTLEGSQIWGRSKTSCYSYFSSGACLEFNRTLGSQPSLSSSIFMEFCYYDTHTQG